MKNGQTAKEKCKKYLEFQQNSSQLRVWATFCVLFICGIHASEIPSSRSISFSSISEDCLFSNIMFYFITTYMPKNAINFKEFECTTLTGFVKKVVPLFVTNGNIKKAFCAKIPDIIKCFKLDGKREKWLKDGRGFIRHFNYLKNC